MASTKRTNVAQQTTIVASVDQKEIITNEIKALEQQLLQKLEQYKQNNNGEEYKSVVTEKEVVKPETKEYNFIRPPHYVQEDGRETWEHMVDKWGEEKTALWCEMTAYKYQDRIGRKPGEDEDREQKKIEWYLTKAEYLRSIAKKKYKFW